MVSLYLGLSYKQLGNLASALQFIQQAINLSYPDYFGSLHFHLADTYMLDKQLPVALEHYQIAYKFDPMKKIILFNIAMAIDQMKTDKKTALTYYEQFLRENIEAQNPDQVNYAKDRVMRLKEDLHFESE